MANTAFNPSDKSASVALTGSNLIATSSATLQWGRAVDRQVAGKFYWEVTATTFAITSSGIGIASTAANLALGFSSTVAPWTCAILRSGLIYVDSVYTNVTLGTIANGTVVCIAVDLTNRRIWFRLGAAGNWNNNAANNPATGVGGISHSIGAGIPAQYPRLAGQHADYTEAQLVAFRGGARKNSVPMSGVAATMNDREIKAVADYIAGLH